MEELEKSVLLNELFDLYGCLLPPSQSKVVTLYYGMDLSLGEIADQEGITRTAVYDALKKGTDSLKEYESRLHLLERRRKLDRALEALKVALPEEMYRLVEKEIKEK